MKRFILLSAILLALALGLGCASQGAVFSRVTNGLSGTAPTAGDVAVVEESGAAANSSKPQVPPAPGQSTDAQNQAQSETRMIVYSGALSLRVNDTAETVKKIGELLKDVNGYVASKSLVAYGKDKLRGSISIRIPAAALETTLAQIKALSVKVLKETANSDDVTAEYVDLDARRKNLEAYEVELTKLLETVRERTGKAEDILAVYNQLTEVRGQIEQIKGRQKYLENTSALATYTIELVPVEEPVVEGKPGWDPGRIFTEALDDLVRALQGLTGLAIRFFVLVLPILLILLLPVALFILVVRWLVRRGQRAKAVTTK